MSRKIWAVANSFGRDEGEEGRLSMPYGDYPGGRAEVEKGKTRQLVQRWNQAGARAVAADLEEERRKGAPGIPVYAGHPDVPELAARYPDKAAKGWVVAVAANESGAELVVEWNGERPRKREFAFFSPYFFGNVEHDDGTTAVMQVTGMGSVGLTNTPRIHAFRVPNEASAGEDLEKQPKGPDMNDELRQKLIEALGLPTDADDEAILAAVTAVRETAAAKEQAEARANEAETAKAEEEKKREAAETAVANEREARVGLMLDQAIAEARVSPAERPRWEKLLKENFEANRVALANEAPKLKTKAAASASAAIAVANEAEGRIDLVAIANEKMRKNPGLSYTAAFAQAMKEHPEVK